MLLCDESLTERDRQAVEWVQTIEGMVRAGEPAPPYLGEVERLVSLLLTAHTYRMFVRGRHEREFGEWLQHHGFT